MLPDFIRVKRNLNRNLAKWVQLQIPLVAPLLAGIATFRQHEGKQAKITRTDKSEGKIEYHQSSFEFAMTSEEMRFSTLPAIQEKLLELAKRVGSVQEKQLLEMATKGANSSGNVVHTGPNFTPDNLLELIRRVPEDFDSRTLEREGGPVFVLHPDTAAKVLPQAKEWEKDPEFKAKLDAIMERKREEWRDREADRKLVS
jgi:hypothetical protein